MYVNIYCFTLNNVLYTSLCTPYLAEVLSVRIGFGGVRATHLCSFSCCPIMHLCVLSSSLWCPLRFPHTNDVYLKLFVGELLSYLRYLCLFAYSGVVFYYLSSLSVLCTQYCQFRWIANFLLLLLGCSLTFNYLNISKTLDKRRSITYSHGSIW